MQFSASAFGPLYSSVEQGKARTLGSRPPCGAGAIPFHAQSHVSADGVGLRRIRRAPHECVDLTLTPVCAWLLHRFAILPEEAYLERKFGDDYLAYKSRVSRWL